MYVLVSYYHVQILTYLPKGIIMYWSSFLRSTCISNEPLKLPRKVICMHCILHGMMAENGTYHKYDQLICRNRSKTILEQWFGKIYIDIHNIGYSMNGKLRLLISCQHFWKNNLFIYYFNSDAMLMLLWKIVFDDHNEIGHYEYY